MAAHGAPPAGQSALSLELDVQQQTSGGLDIELI
jgi:hypothetical protein